MSSSSDKSSPSKSFLSTQTLILSAIAWAVFALFFFLLFSRSTGTGDLDRPLWYLISTYVLEQGAFLSASALCLRNWRSSQVISGRNVWLAIGLGMLFYFIGNLFFGYWELILRREPLVSLGDVFFVLSYGFLAFGMILAVTSRRLNLEKWQWATVGGIVIVGVLIAWLLSSATPGFTPDATPTPSQQQTAPASPSPLPGGAQSAPAVSPEPTEADANAAAWVLTTERYLEPLSEPLKLFYIVADIGLLIVATTLLLAFWGGRFSQSWRLIAAAAFCLYIADIWLNYAQTFLPDYQSGGLLEVFWVFSGVLFGAGAVLEYDVSSKSTRRSSRRRS